MRNARILALAAVSAALAIPAAAGEQEFRWNGKVAAGRAVEIKGVNGDIEAVASPGAEIEVLAVKQGRRSDPSEVKIEVVEHGDGVTICAVYPTPSWSRPNECVPGKGGHMNVRDHDVNVEFTVHVPAGVRFIGRTVNGGVTATGLAASVEAYTVNGGVKLSTRGYARAETVNGSIAASLGRADWSGGLEFETVNGGITLDLPEDISAEVRASTVNGGIETDFPLAVTGKLSRRRLSGTIGKGGRELSLETVNGSIRLRRAP